MATDLRLIDTNAKRAVVVGGVAVLAGALFTVVLLERRPTEELWDWFITVVATFLAALFAVGVFEYQGQQTEKDRQKRLLEALAAELRSNLDLLVHEHRTPFLSEGPTPGRYFKYADAKLIRLDPIVVTENIRSGVFDAEDVYRLTQIARMLQAHNSDVDYLLSLRSSPVPASADAIKLAINELDQRQRTIQKLCEELIGFLRSQEGITVPNSSGATEDGPEPR